MIIDKTGLRVELKGDFVVLQSFGLMEMTIRGVNISRPYTIPADKVPLWIQRKVAVLRVMPHKSPSKYIDNIGRRMQENVFWIHLDGTETDGDDTRETSEESDSETTEDVG